MGRMVFSLHRCARLKILNFVGYVTHATDRPLWTFRLSTLTDDQVPVVRRWLDTVAREFDTLEESKHGMKEVLVLTANKEIEWREDVNWDRLMKMTDALPGEH